jgi:hypothetical protein
MRFNGLRTDAQDVGDTLVGMTFGNQLQNRFLARRENLGLVFSKEGLQQKSMNDRAEERATGTQKLVMAVLRIDLARSSGRSPARRRGTPL